jgi:hypothetical protein
MESMDNVLSAYENVLKKLVLPMFPKISNVDVEYERAVTHDIKITYYINDILDYSESLKVEKETKALFDMMGFEKVYNPWITYRSVKENNVEKEFYSR